MKRLPPVRVDGAEIDPQNPADRARLAETKAAIIRLTNFGVGLPVVADRLRMSVDDVERVLNEGLRELVATDAAEIRARQQAVVNDMKRALYPGMAGGDVNAVRALLGTLDHELKINPGAAAPQRVHLGLDPEAFDTRVEEDMRTLGIHPRGDTPLDVEIVDDDEGWSNT